jgi:hypothetical protein
MDMTSLCIRSYFHKYVYGSLHGVFFDKSIQKLGIGSLVTWKNSCRQILSFIDALILVKIEYFSSRVNMENEIFLDGVFDFLKVDFEKTMHNAGLLVNRDFCYQHLKEMQTEKGKIQLKGLKSDLSSFNINCSIVAVGLTARLCK